MVFNLEERNLYFIKEKVFYIFIHLFFIILLEPFKESHTLKYFKYMQKYIWFDSSIFSKYLALLRTLKYLSFNSLKISIIILQYISVKIIKQLKQNDFTIVLSFSCL